MTIAVSSLLRTVGYSDTSSQAQIEHELLRFADLTKSAVLAIALKHFDDD